VRHSARVEPVALVVPRTGSKPAEHWINLDPDTRYDVTPQYIGEPTTWRSPPSTRTPRGRGSTGAAHSCPAAPLMGRHHRGVLVRRELYVKNLSVG
jgi:hypothetical protein